jgi:AcrR family transcriptional regulator
VESTEPKQARARATRQRLLDAAVHELTESGYARLTTAAVARRAGVSRGAQQNYFPHKATLLSAAVRHLATRHTEELQEQLEGAPVGQARIEVGLDVLYRQYSGRLFAAVLELSLAARSEPELRDVVALEERNVSARISEAGTTIFGGEFAASTDHRAQWATALSAIRGVALLKLLGHPSVTVDEQWSAVRAELVELLTRS